jgi:osmotically inducible lipoprotein OsmB
MTSEEANMKTRILASMAGALVVLALGACSDMSHQEKGTLAGAAIGGVAGNVVTGGSTAGTLGGAAVGGVVGHEATRP